MLTGVPGTECSSVVISSLDIAGSLSTQTVLVLSAIPVQLFTVLVEEPSLRLGTEGIAGMELLPFVLVGDDVTIAVNSPDNR